MADTTYQSYQFSHREGLEVSLNNHCQSISMETNVHLPPTATDLANSLLLQVKKQA